MRLSPSDGVRPINHSYISLIETSEKRRFTTLAVEILLNIFLLLINKYTSLHEVRQTVFHILRFLHNFRNQVDRNHNIIFPSEMENSPMTFIKNDQLFEICHEITS